MFSESEDFPKKIKSQDDAYEFFNWLADHSEVTGLQGWKISRLEDGRPSRMHIAEFTYIIDNDFLFEKRREINDWVDRFCKDFSLRKQYGWGEEA